MIDADATLGSDPPRSPEMSFGNVSADAQLRRIRAARRRVLKFGATLVFLATMLLMGVAWQRDALRIERAKAIAARYAQALAAASGNDSHWPTSFPMVGLTHLDREVAAAMTYVGPKSGWRSASGHQVLAYSDAIVSFIYRRGRVVVAADGDKLHVEWIRESQFQQMGGAIGQPARGQ